MLKLLVVVFAVPFGIRRPAHLRVRACVIVEIVGEQPVLSRLAWVTFKAAQVEFLQGTRAQYRSETQATWSFCGTCGTTVSYENDRRPDEIDLTVGSLDDPEQFPPKGASFEDEKLSWV